MGLRPSSETSSRSSTSKEGDAEVRAHSAVHLLQGAVRSVLGPRRFTSAQTLGDKGGILSVWSETLPSAQDVLMIEAAANGKMAEDAEVLEFRMERREAEGHFGAGIYDLCPAPEGEELLKMLRIPDWDASCCSRAHVDGTGSIGALKLELLTFDEARRELELTFRLV
jgi:Ser-tRNA(Ala) deacylase AlaX